VDVGNTQYLAPAASEHTDGCRGFLFAWRMRNAGLPVVNDETRFPCACGEFDSGTKKPWRLIPADHPTWCVVDGPHPWTECTLTPMVPKEETDASPDA
jgi:hypothetical protein